MSLLIIKREIIIKSQAVKIYIKLSRGFSPVVMPVKGQLKRRKARINKKIVKAVFLSNCFGSSGSLSVECPFS
ncbi:MAG: hypothetical protein ABRQ37_23165 [Candidatus Eremiobacterota bacterium]